MRVNRNFSNANIDKIFWQKVKIGAQDDCWPFGRAANGQSSTGYGKFLTNAGRILAHRFAWESYYKTKIPEKMTILHLCDNPSCCNSMHLYCGTHGDNMRDKQSKGRGGQKKTALTRAKFHAEEILTMRKLKGKIIQKNIAKMFKTGQDTISRIQNSIKHPCKEGYYI